MQTNIDPPVQPRNASLVSIPTRSPEARKERRDQSRAQPESHPPANSSLCSGSFTWEVSEEGLSVGTERNNQSQTTAPARAAGGPPDQDAAALPPPSWEFSLCLCLCLWHKCPHGQTMWQEETHSHFLTVRGTAWSIPYGTSGPVLGAGQRPPPATYTNTRVYTGCSALHSWEGGRHQVPAGSGHPLPSVGGEPRLQRPEAQSQVEKRELS